MAFEQVLSLPFAIFLSTDTKPTGNAYAYWVAFERDTGYWWRASSNGSTWTENNPSGIAANPLHARAHDVDNDLNHNATGGPGDTLYSNSPDGKWTRLPGNVLTANRYLKQQGNGVLSAAPHWGSISGNDVPSSHAGSAHHAHATPVADGTYIVGSKLTALGTNGTITVTGGIITAVQEAT